MYANHSQQYRLLAASFLLAFTVVAMAKDKPAKSKSDPLLITLRSNKVVVLANGKETLASADKAKPGDTLLYTAIYHNRGKTDISGVKASLPVPQGMEYIGISAHPAPVLATVDNKDYAEEPLVRTVKGKNNEETQEAVPYTEYRQLRWEIDTLAAGEKQEVSAKMRVSELPKSAAELVLNHAAPVH
jgi:uncharacterized repeat protein (TIGR01451 family)